MGTFDPRPGKQLARLHRPVLPCPIFFPYNLCLLSRDFEGSLGGEIRGQVVSSQGLTVLTNGVSILEIAE